MALLLTTQKYKVVVFVSDATHCRVNVYGKIGQPEERPVKKMSGEGTEPAKHARSTQQMQAA
jgi:hypothetical protein